MRPILHQQHTALLAAFALLISAASAWDLCEALASTNRLSRIQPFESYPDVVTAGRDARNTNRPFYGVGICRYLAQSGDDSAPAGISRAERLTPVAIIDGHPHNPSKLLLHHVSMAVTTVI
ncbi:MAG: hypothetical protein JOY92_14640 [Verrucomicrobia bacterium]|nr:hypothetical protein [Verrucomicrobiota bacterium]